MDLKEHTLNKILIKVQAFELMKMHLKFRLQNGGHFVRFSMC